MTKSIELEVNLFFQTCDQVKGSVYGHLPPRCPPTVCGIASIRCGEMEASFQLILCDDD